MANPEWTEPEDWQRDESYSRALNEIAAVVDRSESDPDELERMLREIVAIAEAALEQVSA